MSTISDSLTANQLNWRDLLNTQVSEDENDKYNLNVLSTNNNRFYKARRISTREIWTKRIGFIFALGVNISLIAGIGFTVYVYCPSFIPNQALLMSPFIAGVVAALISLKLTTFGISEHNYQNLSNPLNVIGRALALIMFGPLLYLKYKIDWTDYSDAVSANAVSIDLAEKSLKEVALQYGGSISSIRRAGIMDKDDAEEMRRIVDEYMVFLPQEDFLTAVRSPAEATNKGIHPETITKMFQRTTRHPKAPATINPYVEKEEVKEEEGEVPINTDEDKHISARRIDSHSRLHMSEEDEKAMFLLEQQWKEFQEDFTQRLAFPYYGRASILRRKRQSWLGW